MGTICMKSRSLFSEKNKKNFSCLTSAEFAHTVVKVKPKSIHIFSY